MITLLFKKTNPLAITPSRGSDFAAGYDLYSTEEYTLKPLERKLFKTGISIAIPGGLYGRVAPRSGLAYKDGIDVMAGVIDEDYRGDVGVILINLGSVDKAIKPEDKIAQIIFEHYNEATLSEVADLPPSVRGAGGFGSSDAAPTQSPLTDEMIHKNYQHSLGELYKKLGGVPVKTRYADEIKQREQS